MATAQEIIRRMHDCLLVEDGELADRLAKALTRIDDESQWAPASAGDAVQLLRTFVGEHADRTTDWSTYARSYPDPTGLARRIGGLAVALGPR